MHTGILVQFVNICVALWCNNYHLVMVSTIHTLSPLGDDSGTVSFYIIYTYDDRSS